MRRAGRIDVGNVLVGNLQSRHQWVAGWCRQVALNLLVQRQQGIIDCHLLLQEMIALGQQRR
jgi:hypothetical protein